MSTGTAILEPRTELLTAKARNINDFLPPEIFSLIFETLLNIRLEEDLDEAERLTVVQDLPSVDISHVCASWRAVARHTHSIWRIVGVNDQSRPEMVEMVLSRSTVQPVDLEVDLTEVSSEDETEAIVKAMVPHIYRWRKFSWISSQPRGLEIPLSQMQGREAPLLEFLFLDDEASTDQEYDEVYSGKLSAIFNGPESVPRLQTVELWGAPLSWRQPLFAGLVHLEISYIPDGAKPSVNGFLDLLRSCPTLQYLMIQNGAANPRQLMPSYQNPGSPADLPALTSLMLCEFDHPSLFIGTLRCLHAPNLEHLTIQDMYADEEGEVVDFGPAFEVLSTCNFSKLHTLELAQFICESPGTLERLFCSLLQLRRLKVAYVPTLDDVGRERFSEETFRAFLDPTYRYVTSLTTHPISIACPLLEELQTSDVSGLVLGWVVHSRVIMRHPLKKLIHSGANFDEEDISKLLDFGVHLEERNKPVDQ